MLLPQLPKQHDYNVIFMDRPPEEVALSQAKMIERLGTKGASGGSDKVQRQLQAHRGQTLRWLKNAKHMNVLTVVYPDLVKDPGSEVARIKEFLGKERLPHSELMVNAVKPELYRQRQESSNGNL